MSYLEIIILAVVEGITEFLPVSSTGHMIVGFHLLGAEPSDAASAFMVIIQTGAILAIFSAYWQTIQGWVTSWVPCRGGWDQSQEAREQRLYSMLIVLAVIPFGAIGFLNRKWILTLFTPYTVAVALIVGGGVILLEGLLTRKGQLLAERPRESFGWKDALWIGLGQCLSLWPGFSRAAATILAARFCKFSRPAAAELSFLIGVPTIMGTSAYELTKIEYEPGLWPALIVGSLIAWLVAYLSVRWFVRFLERYSMDIFGWYRIGLGLLILFYLVF